MKKNEMKKEENMQVFKGFHRVRLGLSFTLIYNVNFIKITTFYCTTLAQELKIGLPS
jgi:hypothetical protein